MESIQVHQVKFRKMNELDLDFFLSVRNLVRENLHNSRFFSLEEAKEWFKFTKNEYWIIEICEVEVGYFRLSKENQENWQIGADIHPSFQNKGIGSFVYPLFVDSIIKRQPVVPLKLNLQVLKHNSMALRLYEKLGFKRTAESETDYSMELNLE